MKMPKSLLLSFAAATTIALAGCSGKTDESSAASEQANNPTASEQTPKDPDAVSSPLLAAAEPFENLTEQAATAKAPKLAKLITSAKKAADQVSGQMKDGAAKSLSDTIARVEQAETKGDRTAVALAAVEGYRTLVESARDTGPIPRSVSLLDYAGFRYQANMAAGTPGWADAEKAIDFADEQWATLRSKVADSKLRGEFTASLHSMRAAHNAGDVIAAKMAVADELDLVDELEGYFAKHPAH